MSDYQTGEELVNAIMRPLGTNLKNYEMVWKDKAIAVAAEVVSKLSTLRAQNAALQAVASAASIAAEELEYFVDFAVRQCEFEGDEVAGYAAVNAVRNALAQVAK